VFPFDEKVRREGRSAAFRVPQILRLRSTCTALDKADHPLALKAEARRWRYGAVGGSNRHGTGNWTLAWSRAKARRFSDLDFFASFALSPDMSLQLQFIQRTQVRTLKNRLFQPGEVGRLVNSLPKIVRQKAKLAFQLPAKQTT
jgi:hypothetical protein